MVIIRYLFINFLLIFSGEILCMQQEFNKFSEPKETELREVYIEPYDLSFTKIREIYCKILQGNWKFELEFGNKKQALKYFLNILKKKKEFDILKMDKQKNILIQLGQAAEFSESKDINLGETIF